jgi:hypothetical protein
MQRGSIDVENNSVDYKRRDDDLPVTKKTYDILVICRSIFYKGLDGDTINLESPSEKALYRVLLTSETQKNKSGAVIAAFASLLSSNLSLCCLRGRNITTRTATQQTRI